MRRRRQKLRAGATLLCCLAAVIYYVLMRLAPPANVPKGEFALHFIDVGQGDAMLLTCDGHAALIDAGTAESADSLVQYLQEQKIPKPDYIIATHPHADHIGGMAKVIDAVGCETFMMPDAMANTRAFENMLASVEACGAEALFGQAGEMFTLGDAQIRLLWPEEGYQDDNANNVSLVIQVRYGPYSFLLTGDAEKKVERRFAGEVEAVTVLKAGHHGSATSSGNDLMEAAQPEYCVVSVGAGNSYGHPTPSVLEDYANRGCTVLRTDQNGTVVFTVKEGELTYVTAR